MAVVSCFHSKRYLQTETSGLLSSPVEFTSKTVTLHRLGDNLMYAVETTAELCNKVIRSLNVLAPLAATLRTSSKLCRVACTDEIKIPL